MCGVLAIIGDTGPYRSAGALEPALRSQSNRGPDNHGILHLDGCTLAHTRLSIVDLDGGAQPMLDEARGIAISYNGEIYNFSEIRAELQARGHVFRTRSDTEVILKAYAEYGGECVDHFDGMFAFALWDDRKKELFAARDRFGEKPLFHARDRIGNILFASEIKALLALGLEGEVDAAALDHYLFLKYTPRDRSIYRGIHVLPPACRATVRNGALTQSHYWQLARQPCSLSYGEAVEVGRDLIRNSVRRRLTGDVAIGTFLSGGIDSTLIAAFAQEQYDGELRAFSIGYRGDRDELPFARQVAARLGIPIHGAPIPENVMEELEKTAAYFDEPHGDTANVAQQLLSALVAQHGKVALAGDGADELFLGYDWYREAAATAAPADAYMEKITIFPEDLRRSLLARGEVAADRLPASLPNPDGEDEIDAINRFDIAHYLSGQLLPKVDRASMMHGLEVRCPFLDHKLAQFAYSLPREYKMDRSSGKRLLRDLCRKVMPGDLASRPKQGFGAPLQDWLEAPPTRDYVNDRLGAGARIYDYLSAEAVRRVTAEAYRTRSGKGYYRLWVLLCLELWLSSRLVKGGGSSAPPARTG
jgi:asparagine synthase (glutamine-hydrolysing)